MRASSWLGTLSVPGWLNIGLILPAALLAGSGCTRGSECGFLLTCETSTTGGSGGTGGTGGTGATTTSSTTSSTSTTGGTGGMPDTCGNGMQESGEECDDGDKVDGDGCDSNCTVTACGNDVTTAGEECDDGNSVNGDGCDDGCILSKCGNSILAGDEDCDDGNTMGGDGCGPSCAVEPGYECDMLSPSTCHISCGDGTLDTGEECDVGAPVAGDGCADNCKMAAGYACSNPDGMGKPTVCTPKSCDAIFKEKPGAADGVYTVDPDGNLINAPIDVYCDMVSGTGGWTLVLQNNATIQNPNPNISEVENAVNIMGTFGSDLTQFDLFLGLKHWMPLGTQLRMEVGVNPTAPTRQAVYAFSFGMPKYKMTLGAGGITVGTLLDPGLKTDASANQLPISTSDEDNDKSAAQDCASDHGFAWWYGACWSGSFWGSIYPNTPPFTTEAYWVGAGAEHYPYGAIWVK